MSRAHGSDRTGETARWVFGASVAAAVLAVTFMALALGAPMIGWTDMEAYARGFEPGQVVQLVPVLLLCPVVVVLMSSLYGLAHGRARTHGLVAVVFSSIYAAIISANYIIQLYVVRLNLQADAPDGLALLAMPNPHSVFAAFEILGYGYFALAALFAGLAFDGTGRRRWIRRSLLASGLTGVTASATGVAGARLLMLSGFGLSLLAFLVAVILLAIHFRPGARAAPPNRLTPTFMQS